MPTVDPGRIFISYRRRENGWPARQLYEALSDVFGEDQVFKDVDSIEPGDNFVESVRTAVSSCTVLLALVGTNWANLTDKQGRRRLDDPEDYVRLEIETALRRGIRVIPILIDDAEMPKPQDLPPRLTPLVNRQAITISPVTFDTSRLVRTIRDSMQAAVAVAPATEMSEAPSHSPSDHPDWDSVPDFVTRHEGGLSTPSFGGPEPSLLAKVTLFRAGRGVVIVAIALLLIAGATVWYLRGGLSGGPGGSTGTPTAVHLSDDQLIVSMSVGGNWDLYLASVDSPVPGPNVTADPGKDFGANLSEDRGAVIFRHTEPDAKDSTSQLRLLSVTGDGDRTLFSTVPGACDSSITHPAWNPIHSSQLAVACKNAVGRYRLFVIDLDGSAVTPIDLPKHTKKVGDPSFSPDGEKLVFWGATAATADGGALYVANLTNASVVQLTPSKTGVDADPSWSPDGKSIAFRRTIANNKDIYITPSDGHGDPTPVVRGSRDEDNPSFSPDSGSLAYLRWGPKDDHRLNEVRIINLESGESRALWTQAVPDDSEQGAPIWTRR